MVETVQVMPVNPANWTAEASYTLALVDFSSISDPDPRGEYRHYLNNGVQVAAGEIDLSTGTLVTSYAGALRLLLDASGTAPS